MVKMHDFLAIFPDLRSFVESQIFFSVTEMFFSGLRRTTLRCIETLRDHSDVLKYFLVNIEVEENQILPHISSFLALILQWSKMHDFLAIFPDLRSFVESQLFFCD